MNVKEATVLEYILEHQNETLTTHNLSTHIDMSADELHDIINELEDRMLVIVGARTPQGHCYDIKPTPYADQELESVVFSDSLREIKPGFGPSADHSFISPEA